MSDTHLTPAKLIGNMTMPQEWQEAKTAFVCYTPYPQGFEPYVQEVSSERYFIHSPENEVRLCSFSGIPFLVLSEIYGFPVGATTVEELTFRNIDTIIGVGYAGAFNAAPMGQKFIAMKTMSDLPQAKHYGVDTLTAVQPSKNMVEVLLDTIGEDIGNWGLYTVWNSNSLYREHPALVRKMKDECCDAVNMDVLSLYAVAPVCARESGRDVRFIYVGTITDSESTDPANWNSNLADIVRGKGRNPHEDLVRFLVEDFLPNIA